MGAETIDMRDTAAERAEQARRDRALTLEFLAYSSEQVMQRQEEGLAAHTFIVCGGRDFSDYVAVKRAMDALRAKRWVRRIRHGAAPGADTLAERWAIESQSGVHVVRYPADWSTHGKAAGPMRNQKMVDDGACGCIAFPGGAGTADCARRCEAAGIKVWRPYG